METCLSDCRPSHHPSAITVRGDAWLPWLRARQTQGAPQRRSQAFEKLESAVQRQFLQAPPARSARQPERHDCGELAAQELSGRSSRRVGVGMGRGRLL